MTKKLMEYIPLSAVLIGLGWWGYHQFIEKPEQREQKRAINRAEDMERFRQWAYVAQEKEIAPGESVRLVVVPSPMGEFFDTKCIIYTNKDLRMSSMTCPGAEQIHIEEGK